MKKALSFWDHGEYLHKLFIGERELPGIETIWEGPA